MDLLSRSSPLWMTFPSAKPLQLPSTMTEQISSMPFFELLRTGCWATQSVNRVITIPLFSREDHQCIGSGMYLILLLAVIAALVAFSIYVFVKLWREMTSTCMECYRTYRSSQQQQRCLQNEDMRMKRMERFNMEKKKNIHTLRELETNKQQEDHQALNTSGLSVRAAQHH